jgi:hypothetical protein
MLLTLWLIPFVWLHIWLTDCMRAHCLQAQLNPKKAQAQQSAGEGSEMMARRHAPQCAAAALVLEIEICCVAFSVWLCCGKSSYKIDVQTWLPLNIDVTPVLSQVHVPH